MTDEEINKAIHSRMPQLYVIVKYCYAPFCYYREDAAGYTDSLSDAWKVDLETAQKYQLGTESDWDKVGYEPVPPPDYCNNLNETHRVWESLTMTQKKQFEVELYRVVISDGDYNRNDDAMKITNASAKERAMALLATLTPQEQ